MLCGDLNGKEIQKRGDTCVHMGFPGGLDSKELPAMQDTWVQSLGWEDPLEEEVATYFSIFTWRIPWTEEPASYSLWGHKESG